MVTPVTLVARHPEFQDVAVPLITLCIAEAVAQLDTTVIPAAVLDIATDHLACDKLARSPHGLPLALVRGDGRTIYLDEVDRIIATHGRAYRLEGA